MAEVKAAPVQLPNPDLLQVVTGGIVQLDRVDPDWWRGLDWNTLDQADPELCVLGQWAGDWLTGLARLWPNVDPELRWRLADEHGFWVWSVPGFADDDESAQVTDACLARYQQLTKLWKAIVRARQEVL